MPPITENTPVRFSDPLPDAVDVVVIGAGVAGTATAYFLAQRGQKVLLCEKGRVAGEQSSRNWGWIRQQGRDHAELPIMMESNRIWQGLAKETGERDLAFTQGGCLYLASGPAEVKKYEAWYALAKQHQLDTRMLTKAELESRYPGLGGNWAGGMVTPSDGRGEPFVAVPALARATQWAKDCGLEIEIIDAAGGSSGHRGMCGPSPRYPKPPRHWGVHRKRPGRMQPCRSCRRRLVHALRDKCRD